MEHDSRWKDRLLTDGGSQGDLLVERRWLPDADGHLTRCVAYTSIPHLTPGLGSDSFRWGDTSPGSYDLALNALEHTLARRGHRGPRSTAPDCFTLALLLRSRFVSEIIAGLPYEGGHVSAHDIDCWLDQRTRELPLQTAALLAARYSPTEGAHATHWTRAEWEILAGEALGMREDDLVTRTGRAVARALDPHPLSTRAWESHPL